MQRRPMYKKPYLGRSKVSDHLAVYHNAFSTATTNPKIPDGKAYHSAGIRLQAVKEFSNDSSGTMEFFFFPGINNGCWANSVVAANFGDTSMPYTNHAVVTGTTQNVNGEISKWRLVSQATKISLVNNSDENDGWWEAIRVQTSNNPNSDNGFDVVNVSGLSIIGGPQGGIPGMNVGITNLVEHPTYCTGKLRDIHRHIFDLMPQGSDHDFQTFPQTGLSTNAYLDTENYDCIFVRIHGRAGAETPTRVMIHTVSNQEVLYNESGTLSRFHSEADNHNAIFQASKRKRQNGTHKAAKKPRTALISTY